MRPSGTCIDTVIIHNISLPPSTFQDVDYHADAEQLSYIDALFSGTLPSVLQTLDSAHAHPYIVNIADLKVSSHFLIERSGMVKQYVSTDLRAWHAGQSTFCTPDFMRDNVNDFSIGVELEGDDFHAFADVQYTQLMRLLLSLRRTYALRYVTGHQHIASGRKTDPGPYFDWDYLAHHSSLITLPRTRPLLFFY